MRKFRHYVIFISSALLLFFFILYFSLAINVAVRAESDTKSKSDAILVLGARSYIEGVYNPCLGARVAHAVELYKAGFASKIIVSGGYDLEDNVNEAETMKKIAIEKGVPSENIILEKSAASTYENFILSQKILKKNKLKSVIIATEPFHMARSSFVAEKVGYDYSTSPAKNSPCWQPNKYFTKYFLKEPLAIIQYKLQGKL